MQDTRAVRTEMRHASTFRSVLVPVAPPRRKMWPPDFCGVTSIAALATVAAPAAMKRDPAAGKVANCGEAHSSA
jgi:hypothetical protein